jgi:hypothetical protein
MFRYVSIIALVMILLVAGCGENEPTATRVPPTEVSEVPSDTPVPPTETAIPATSTEMSATDTPVPPTATPAPTMTDTCNDYRGSFGRSISKKSVPLFACDSRLKSGKRPENRN